jgi:hypothetical protein
MMEKPKRYLSNPVVSCGEEEDGALLFNPDTNDSAIINPTGQVIWSFLATPHSLDEIAAHLAEFFQGVSTEQASQDATRFIQALAPDFVLETSDGN